jgi:transcriptional regulator GlxA family with amidase domain
LPPGSIDAIAAEKGRKLRFGFILTEQFSLLAFSCFLEVLRQMEDHGVLTGKFFCEWYVLGEENDATFHSSSGVPVSANRTYSENSALDFLVVVGGRRAAAIPKTAQNFVRRQIDGDTVLIALDTGTFAVARAGLFENRRFCIHWFHHHEFVDEFPHLKASIDAIFLIEGNFISCAGGTWAADLAIYIVSRLWGARDSARAVSIMGLDRMRSYSHYQLPFYDGPTIRDPSVRRAIQLIERRSGNPPSVKELAREAQLSPRQLERRFVDAVGSGPLSFSRSLRLRFAHSLLIHSSRSIAQIAFDCGFSDQSHFTRLFRSQFGSTPGALRQKQSVQLE